MARLTTNQWEAMQCIVEHKHPYGYLIHKTVPSLIKRGLVVEVPVKLPDPRFMVRPSSPFVPQPCHPSPYRLTPKGLEAFLRVCEQRKLRRLQEVEDEYERDVRNARGRTVQDDQED